MKIVLACLACTIGCGFASRVIGEPDAAVEIDSGMMVVDAAPDAPIDAVPIDVAETGRTRSGLIGLWEFDDPAGGTVADTSGVDPAVPLTASFGTMTFAAGTMTPNTATPGGVVIASAPRPRLDQSVIVSRAVTLEAWVRPSLAEQGSSGAPALVAGLTGNINSRNIALHQVGPRWLARVRTSDLTGMTDANGKPDLLSVADVVVEAPTHLVVVADASQRILYVNGVISAMDPVPGPPLNWDQSYAMRLGNELSANRQWVGAFSLVAIYAQALTPAQVLRNFEAGPEAK